MIRGEKGAWRRKEREREDVWLACEGVVDSLEGVVSGGEDWVDFGSFTTVLLSFALVHVVDNCHVLAEVDQVSLGHNRWGVPQAHLLI